MLGDSNIKVNMLIQERHDKLQLYAKINFKIRNAAISEEWNYMFAILNRNFTMRDYLGNGRKSGEREFHDIDMKRRDVTLLEEQDLRIKVDQSINAGVKRLMFQFVIMERLKSDSKDSHQNTTKQNHR